MDKSCEEEISAMESESITKAKFKNEEYSLQRIPCALFLECAKIYHMGSDVRNVNVHALQKEDVPLVEEVRTKKLKVNFYYTSELCVRVISKKFFDSREDIDKLFFKSWWSNDTSSFPKKKANKLHTVSFADVLKKFDCKISCNMEYYLSQKHVIENELNLKLDNFQPNNARYVCKLEKKLFFKLLLDIFGDENNAKENEDQTIFFKNFYMLLDRIEYKIATAERGDYYITFAYNLN